MTNGRINWMCTVRNAIMGGMTNWIVSWQEDAQMRPYVNEGLKEYEDYIKTGKCKYFDTPPTEYELIMWNKYKSE